MTANGSPPVQNSREAAPPPKLPEHLSPTSLLLKPVELRQLRARAQRGVHHHSCVELGVVDLVSLALLVIADHRLEPVAPEYLGANVARPCNEMGTVDVN